MGDIEERLLKFRQSNPHQETTNKEKKFFSSSSSSSSTLSIIQNWFLEKFKFKQMAKPNFKPTNTITIKEDDQNEEEDDENEDKEENIESFKIYILKLFLKFALWSTLFALFIRFEFGLVYFVVSLLVLIYLNTNKRSRRKRRGRGRGELSAYSVFNKNVERIQGTITAEQLQNNLIGGGLF